MAKTENRFLVLVPQDESQPPEIILFEEESFQKNVRAWVGGIFTRSPIRIYGEEGKKHLYLKNAVCSHLYSPPVEAKTNRRATLLTGKHIFGDTVFCKETPEAMMGLTLKAAEGLVKLAETYCEPILLSKSDLPSFLETEKQKGSRVIYIGVNEASFNGLSGTKVDYQENVKCQKGNVFLVTMRRLLDGVYFPRIKFVKTVVVFDSHFMPDVILSLSHFYGENISIFFVKDAPQPMEPFTCLDVDIPSYEKAFLSDPQGEVIRWLSD